MYHQRISRQGQKFIKNEEGNDVPRQRNTGAGGNTETEKGKKTVLVGPLVEIANGIEGGDEPQHRRKGGKEKSQGIQTQRKGQVGRQRENKVVGRSAQIARSEEHTSELRHVRISY